MTRWAMRRLRPGCALSNISRTAGSTANRRSGARRSRSPTKAVNESFRVITPSRSYTTTLTSSCRVSAAMDATLATPAFESVRTESGQASVRSALRLIPPGDAVGLRVFSAQAVVSGEGIPIGVGVNL